MQSGIITTPFGRRSMTLAMLATQLEVSGTDSRRAIDKWKLFRSVYEARERLGVSDRTLAVLNALLSFYPKNELSEENGTVVFPSNAQLSVRTHGMAGTTLRRHLTALVEAGLIIRKDSPNGKRYARKTKAGDLRDAFGFNLAPLLARADEIEQFAAEVVADRQHLKRLKEQLTLCRRDIMKLIETALEEQLPGDWTELQLRLRDMALSLPRTPETSQIEHALGELEHLREKVLNSLKTLIKAEKKVTTERQNGGHIQNSDINSKSESETSADVENSENQPEQAAAVNSASSIPSLATVLQACPEIAIYGPSGSISNWRDLMIAASVVRNTLAVSKSAYEQACKVMGPQNTAAVMACILERAGQINSAGGYLRDLTRKAECHQFSPKPMLMALMRANPAARTIPESRIPPDALASHSRSKERRLTI